MASDNTVILLCRCVTFVTMVRFFFLNVKSTGSKYGNKKKTERIYNIVNIDVLIVF